MRFEEVDHPPFMNEGGWPDTWERWYREGYPKGTSYEDFFGVDTLKFEYAGLSTGAYPLFEEKILSEGENEVIKIDSYGT